MRILIDITFTILRIFVGVVFSYSGWNKLARPTQEFQYAIEAYQLFPSEIIRLIAHTIPWIELFLGVSMLLGFFRAHVAKALSILTASFIVLLISTKMRGIEIANCGCFGEGIHLTVLQALSVDSCLFLILILLAKRKTTFFELDRLMGV